jgi:hypothetical protein
MKAELLRVALLLLVSRCLLAVAQSEDCFSNPASDSCTDFKISEDEVMVSIQNICKEDSLGVDGSTWPSGCAIAAACNSQGPSNAGSGLCEPIGLLLEICEESASNSDECTKYKNLCATGSKVPVCDTVIAPENTVIPSVESVYKVTINMCNAMPDMVGCETCTDVSAGASEKEIIQACPNPLQSLATVCLGMYMAGCEVWIDFCKAVGKADPLYNTFCVASAPTQVSSMDDATMNMNNSMQDMSSSNQESCIPDPTQAACADYTMPDSIVQEDLKNLCDSMPNMVGCSLWTACRNETATGSSCAPFTLLGTICEEMGSMRDCANYNSMCTTKGSVVQQCITEKPIPNAPSTQEATDTVMSLCADHGMVGCEKCTAISNCPHPLDTLSEICLGMPYMAGCDKFFSMCKATGDDFGLLCGTSDDYQGLPPMRMWLHTGIRDIVLIKEWVPTDGGYYFGTLVACFFAAVFVQWLKGWKIQQEITWASRRPLLPCRNAACGSSIPHVDEKGAEPECCGGSSSSGGAEPSGSALPRRRARASQVTRSAFQSAFGWCIFTKSQFKRNIVRSLFSGIIVFMDYMLMLIVMTFNIGIILAVVLGFAVGSLLFGHVGERAGSISTEDPSPVSEEIDVRFMEAPSCCGATGHL